MALAAECLWGMSEGAERRQADTLEATAPQTGDGGTWAKARAEELHELLEIFGR